MGKVSQARRVTARMLVGVVGKIMSTNLVTGNMARIMTKALHVCIESRLSWDSQLQLSEEGVNELLFWKENVESMNEAVIGPKPNAQELSFRTPVVLDMEVTL